MKIFYAKHEYLDSTIKNLLQVKALDFNKVEDLKKAKKLLKSSKKHIKKLKNCVEEEELNLTKKNK